MFMIGSSRLAQLGAHLSSAKFNFNQATMSSLLVPPPSVRGQNKLDYEAFKVKLTNIPCVTLPKESLNKFRGKLKDYLLKLRKFKPVQHSDTVEGESVIYLDPQKIKDLSDGFKKELSESKLLNSSDEFEKKDVELAYENWTSDEVLRAILPEDIEVPSSYSLIGHIAHLNLREEQLPYKNVIGQVFLDKIPSAKTVVNKLDSIDSTYRNFAMEILAGEDDTIVLVKESGFTYHFDFAKVYWNPRLGTEHAALVNSLKAGDVLYDVFAGVGPFAVPAARKGVKVLANDLNPESHKYLLKNAQANKVSKNLTAFNKDGRDFIRDDVKKDILERRENGTSGSEHMAMNLPALAVEFLDVFSNWLTSEEVEKVCSKPPTVHVYCFIKAAKTEDFKSIAKSLVEENLGSKIPPEALVKVHHVRNVAPNKEMMRVSFALTKDVLVGGEEPAKKKLKLNDESLDVDCNFPGNNNGQQEQEQS